jgi:hypothetical protein
MISVAAAPPRFIGAFAAEAHSVMAEESILKLRADLAWVFALVWAVRQVVRENLSLRLAATGSTRHERRMYTWRMIERVVSLFSLARRA